MLTTTPGPAPGSLEDVRLSIFRQHTQLQQLFDELEELAAGVLERGASASAMRNTLRILYERFTRHLVFEETHLAPIVERFISGAAEVRSMREEHVEQRAQIDALVHDAASISDASTYARETLAFIHAIRRDMVAEELWLRTLG